MPVPPPTAGQLAQLVLRHLGGGSGAAGSWSAALEAACGRLRADLSDTLGSGGTTALLVRALYRATRTHPVLTDVTVDHPSGGTAGSVPTRCFSGLEPTFKGAPEEVAAEATTAILSELFGLLVTFLGEDLALQPAIKFWPGVMPDVKEIGE